MGSSNKTNKDDKLNKAKDLLEKYGTTGEGMIKYYKQNKKFKIDSTSLLDKGVNFGLLINKMSNNEKFNNEYVCSDNKYIDNIIGKFNEDQEGSYIKGIKTYLETCSSFLTIRAKINDKLLIGFGGESTNEVDITLHHTYGIPYIPGSTLKGCFRSHIIQEYFDSYEDEAKKDDTFVKIFGGKNREGKEVQGKVIFMDSFPNNDNFQLVKEVMTPHHQKYNNPSEKIDFPLDSDEAIPIFYLVVKEKEGNGYKNKKSEQLNAMELALIKSHYSEKRMNSYFIINIAIDKSISDAIVPKKISPIGIKIKDFIENEFQDMLKSHGLGAKTSVGYGYFDIVEMKDPK